MDMSPEFNLDEARRYWRHAPAGSGKVDTDALVAAGETSADVWDAAFRSRLLAYPEEEQFLRTFAAGVRGLRLVSIGSGLGFHELFYAAHGARVTCCDIVATNLAAIERAAARRRLTVDTFCRPDLTTQALPGPADVVFVYGCLMHMPPDAQRALFARVRAALAPGGRVVLMVYAWEFAHRLCGWTDPAAFDPVAFARASDPTVGDEACPWSDWHDDRKLLALAGDGSRVTRRQAWNDEQFVWYELSESPAAGEPPPFFEQTALADGDLRLRLRPRDFTAEDATLERRWRRVTVHAAPSRSSYVLASRVLDAPARANAVAIDVAVEQGASSAGILDVDAQRFVSVATRSTRGRHAALLLADPLPRRFQIVLSNHQPKAPAPGVFVVYGARVLARPIATLADGDPQSAIRNPQS